MTFFLVFDILQVFVKLLVMSKYDSLLGRICENYWHVERSVLRKISCISFGSMLWFM